jgi:hypothetical protein
MYVRAGLIVPNASVGGTVIGVTLGDARTLGTSAKPVAAAAPAAMPRPAKVRRVSAPSWSLSVVIGHRHLEGIVEPNILDPALEDLSMWCWM